MEQAAAAPSPSPAVPTHAAAGEPSGTLASSAETNPAVMHAQDRQVSLDQALDALSNKVRDIEVALIGRIADVDDDRRRTGIEVRRALDAQRDEIDDDLRRRTLATTLLILLALVIAIGAPVFNYMQADATKVEISDQLTGIQEAVARLSEIDTAPLDKRLGQLDEAVSRLSGDLNEKVEARQSGVNDLANRLKGLEETLASKTAPPPEPSPDLREDVEALETADADLAKKVEDLQKAQERLGKDMLQLRDSLASILASANLPLEQKSFAPEEGTPSDQPGEGSSANPAETLATVVGSEDGERDQQSLTTHHKAGDHPTTPAPGDQPEAQPPAPATGPTLEPPSLGTGTSVAAGDQVAEVEQVQAEQPFVLEEGRQAVQLITFRDLEDVRRFAQREDMPARVYFRIESRGGRPWYAVFYGLYPDATAAATAKADLAAELATLKPIVRPLAAGDQLHFLDRAP
ncbi:MAG: hypothetical protein EP309_09985 [Gammaproteobacteria bacterium]|nr:MAG: hypothetical protein EP309_09985 [Gammaproteobacteria bacterium]